VRSPTIAATSKQHFYATHMVSNPMSKNGSICVVSALINRFIAQQPAHWEVR
jgi:hypothetical protein